MSTVCARTGREPKLWWASEMEVGWPEGIWIAYTLFMLTSAALLNGHPHEPWPKKWSFPVSVMSAVWSFLLLWWGGFFAPTN